MNRKFKVRSFAAKTAVLIGISLLIPGLSPGADRMVVENDSGATTLKIQDSGTLGTLGNLSVGTMDSPATLTVVKGGSTETTSFTNYATLFFNTGSTYFGFRNTTDNAEGIFGIGGGEGARFGLGSVTDHPMEFFVNSAVQMVLRSNGALSMTNGASCTSGGVWTNASSREYKQDIRELPGDKALEALEDLKPVAYRFKTDPDEEHLGFIAEDVPDLVATRDRKGMSPMDVVAVLTRVVHDQQKMVRAQQKAISELTRKVTELEKALSSKETPALAKVRLGN
jgi:hypothetical protein